MDDKSKKKRVGDEAEKRLERLNEMLSRLQISPMTAEEFEALERDIDNFEK